ncbi:hypothetical protein [Beijerinckia sp. L45]|uniref:hypothetical protein n=1 Tax=Beijerinckia sp. L45 TaxID=1641855 RepID=UPI00131BE11C|nr:hypothetical protein [Beijerinckia sp. L45]
MIGDGSASALGQIEALEHRRIPCICPRQHEKTPPLGVTTDIQVTRGIIVEAVQCVTCDRRWKRVNT